MIFYFGWKTSFDIFGCSINTNFENIYYYLLEFEGKQILSLFYLRHYTLSVELDQVKSLRNCLTKFEGYRNRKMKIMISDINKDKLGDNINIISPLLIELKHLFQKIKNV